MHTQHNPAPRVGFALRVMGVLLTASLHAADAGATFISISPVSPVAITMRVGTPTAGTVDNVVFPTISGANISPSPVTVTYGSDVTVEVLAERSLIWTPDVVVTVDSSAGLACTGGGCGATVIPFSEVCWVSTNPATGSLAGQDIQNGCFNGSAVQQIAAFGTVTGSSRLMRNFLRFSYSNSRVYPAGNYRGRVTYTATMP